MLSFIPNQILTSKTSRSSQHLMIVTLKILSCMHTRAISRFLRLLSFRVGFMKEEITKVEWNGKQHSVLLFNGKPVIYKGISIHVHKEKTGYYVKDDIRKEDFEILKKNNFKEFCFSHYPNSRQMYHLCD